jgi:hypothetical protein
MAFHFRSLSAMQKGIICIVSGILILLYAFNFFQRWLNLFVIGGALCLIVYGCIKLGWIEKIKELTEGKKKH